MPLRERVFGLDASRRTLLILSQAYVPDPASVGQHMHDVAVAMVRRGFEVVVVAADRGYEDPSLRYPSHELLDGVRIFRVPLSSFGKSSIAVRLAGGAAFVAQATALALALPRIDHLLLSTSPPICALAGIAIAQARRVPTTYWAMDINPDQAVASGALPENAASVKAFDLMNRQILSRADHVVTLDRFMAERLEAKAPIGDRLAVIPPWSHVDPSDAVPARDANSFRIEHGLSDKLVVMYSGNLSPAHPITTLLEAARRMQDREDVAFVLVGGGLGRREAERYAREHGLSNVRTLPYQPLSELRVSLSAADVHLVSMGEAMVGIVHPCKVYGAMSVGRPVLVLGPQSSHVAELVLGHGFGWHVDHGDVKGAERLLRRLADMAPAELAAMGRRGHAVIEASHSRAQSCSRVCDLLER